MKTFYIKPLIVISVLIAVYFIFSCKKDTSNTIVINGRVYDPNQNAYIANANVSFLSSKIVAGTYNPAFVTVANATSDANGNFHIEYTKGKDAAFEIIVTKDNYYEQDYNISVTDMPGGTYTPTYNIYSGAYFKIHVKNTMPYDGTDQIGFSFVNTQPSCYTCCNSIPKVGLGYSFDSTSVCNTYGAQKMHVQWTVKKNGITNQYDSSIYCKALDTTLFELFY